MKVIASAEHWLWPYELVRLDDINANFECIAKADNRLTEVSAGGRGFWRGWLIMP